MYEPVGGLAERPNWCRRNMICEGEPAISLLLIRHAVSSSGDIDGVSGVA